MQVKDLPIVDESFQTFASDYFFFKEEDCVRARNYHSQVLSQLRLRVVPLTV